MPEIQSIIRVGFYSTTCQGGRVSDPYDCSKQDSKSDSGNHTKYCLQSRFHSCAMRVHCPIKELGGDCAVDEMAKLAAFLPCSEADGPSGLSTFDNALPCAKKHGLDVEKILACHNPKDVSYTGPAVAAIDAIGNATNAVSDPAIQYYPDVRVGGELIRTTPTAALLIQYACAAYKGSQRPPACSSPESQVIV